MQVGIEGKFYKSTLTKIGTGATRRIVEQKTYWFIKEENNALYLSPLAMNGVATSISTIISYEEFAKKFLPELRYPDTTYTITEELKEQLIKVISLYITYKEVANIQILLNELLEIPKETLEGLSLFFKEIADILRKDNLLLLALASYKKALELEPNNTFLYITIARVHFDNEEYTECVENLLHAINLREDTTPIIHFLEYMMKENQVPEKYIPVVKTILEIK